MVFVFWGLAGRYFHVYDSLSLPFLFQILLIMTHPPLVSSLVDVLVNGDEVASAGTPEDSPLPLRKVIVIGTLVKLCYYDDESKASLEFEPYMCRRLIRNSFIASSS